jgi:hypothetical protein
VPPLSTAELIGLFTEFLETNWGLLKSIAIVSAGFFLITPLAAPVIVVLMPADVLVRPRRPLSSRPPGRRALFVLWHIVKNLLGWALMAIGFLLLFLPGQGLLTILCGLTLADVPGKRRLLSRLLSARGVRVSVDRLRRKYGRAELVLKVQEPEQIRYEKD